MLCRQTLADDLDTVSPFTERKLIVFETNPWNCLAYAGRAANPALCKRRNVEQVPLSLLLWEQVPLAFPSLFLQAASWEPGPGCSCLFFFFFFFFFTASSPTGLLNVFVHANIACFSSQTFNSLQVSCLVTSIRRGARDTSSWPGGERTSSWLEMGGAIQQATVPSMEATP